MAVAELGRKAVFPPAVGEHKVVSLFSGCGGLDLGFQGGFTALGRFYERHPFRVTWANDVNAAACRTYRRNIGSHIVWGDVWDVIDLIPKRADVIIGGFPCQDISINGKGAGANGKRSGLYRAMVEAIDRTRPKVFVAENVKGLLMKHNVGSLEQVLRDFGRLGYNVSYRLYQVADYGVPQSRERVIFVGTAPELDVFVPPSPLTPKRPITAAEAISDLESSDENPRTNHIWSRASRSPDQGNRVLKADKPAHTIRAECHGNIQWHYKLNRRISMREAARFQSFPDCFLFDAQLRETERQVGNAVPPVFGWHLAQAVANVLAGTAIK